MNYDKEFTESDKYNPKQDLLDTELTDLTDEEINTESVFFI